VLGDCIERLDRKASATPYEMESVTVDDAMIANDERLGSLRGRQLVLLTFMIKGCRVGASLLIDPENSTNARIISVFYLAG
jgi:hypothetical protein